MMPQGVSSESMLASHYASVRKRLTSPVNSAPPLVPRQSGPAADVSELETRMSLLADAERRLADINERIDRATRILASVEHKTDIIARDANVRIMIADIQRLVGAHFGFSREDIISARRTGSLVIARHVAMFLAKTMTNRSYPQIGQMFGFRDHTTIMHGVKKIEREIAHDMELAATVSVLSATLIETAKAKTAA